MVRGDIMAMSLMGNSNQQNKGSSKVQTKSKMSLLNASNNDVKPQVKKESPTKKESRINYQPDIQNKLKNIFPESRNIIGPIQQFDTKESPLKKLGGSIGEFFDNYQNKPTDPNTYDQVSDLGGYKFGSNAFPVKKDDNIAQKSVKSVGNFVVGLPSAAMNVLSAPGEAIRQASVRTNDAIQGNQQQPFQRTSFTKDILPKSASTKIEELKKSKPIIGGLAEMGLETVADPMTWLGGGSKSSIAAKSEKSAFESNVAKSMEKRASELAQKGTENAPLNEVNKLPGMNKIAESHQNSKQIDNAINGSSEIPNKLPDNLDELQTMVDSMKEKQWNGIPINLQLFAEAEQKLKGLMAKVDQNVGDINTARAKINDTPTKAKGNFSKTVDKLRTQLEDKFTPAKTLERNISGKLGSAEGSFYKQLRLSAGVPERANLIIEKELKPIIRSVEDAGYSYKDLTLYAEAVHARDVNKAGIYSGLTNSEIDDIIKNLNNPVLESARKNLVKFSDDRLKSLLDSGRISKSSYDAMKDKWKNYIPLNRVFGEEEMVGNSLKQSFANVGSSIKKLKGSERKIIDPIESLIKNTYKIENEASIGKVGQQFSSLAKKDIDSTFVRRLDDLEEVGTKNVINIKEDGVKVRYQVSPEISKMMLSLEKEKTPAVIAMLSKPASVLRAGATLTPDFALRNPMRDIYNAWMVNNSGFNPITDFAAGLASTVKKGKLYKDFIKNNGGYGNILSMDRQAHRKAIESMLKQPMSKKIVSVVNPKSWLNLLRLISDTTESATKVGLYRSGIRKGFTPAEAAYQSRDIMDFARTGTTTQNANRIVAFLNANIQGKSKLIRAIKENPTKVIPKIAVSMAVPSIGIFSFNAKFASKEQKQLIDDSPDWLRDSFWLVAIPGTDQVARIPKPFDVASVSNVVERFLDYAIKNDKESFDKIISNTAKEQSIPVMITGITPIIEGMANYSFFRQAPIIPQREQNLQMNDQKDAYTSETAKALSGLVRKATGEEGLLKNFGSPRVMDNTIRQTTAGLGTYASTAIDSILGKLGVVEEKNLPNKNISQKPVIKSFIVNTNQSGRSMEFIYDTKDKLQKEKNSASANKSEFNNNSQLKLLNSATGKIGDITSKIRKITNDKSISSEKKKELINKLSKERNDISNTATKKYKDKFN
jgi:hypothetical protein